MDKPEWSQAPEWARYLAQDKDGEWYWFEYEPEPKAGYWNLDRCVGQSEKANKEEWTLTLEQRP
jgi:hypothetical protein